jgi:hypothetical protein
MSITPTTIPLLLLIAFLWWRTKGEILSIVLFTSIFDAASAIDIGKMGLSPWIFALALGVGLKLLLGHHPLRPIIGTNTAAWHALVLFIVYAFFTSIVFPVIFRGSLVMSSHDTAPAPLAWGAANLTQMCYLLAIIAICALALYGSRANLHSGIQWYIRGCIVASLFAIYQLANAVFHIPYPAELLYSNKGHVIYPAYMIKGMWRLDSTFPEASEMATYISIGVALLGWEVAIRPFQLRRTCYFLLLVWALLFTMSSLGYATLLFLIVGLTALSAFHSFRRKGLSSAKLLILLCLVCTGSTVCTFTDAGNTADKVIRLVLLEKTDTSSYRERTSTNAAALDTAFHTYYMGAGWGSVRASGLIYVLLGNIGIPGLLLFAVVLALTFKPFFERKSIYSELASDHYKRSLFGLLTAIFGLAVAGAEPVAPILWFLLASGIAAYPKLRRTGLHYKHLSVIPPFDQLEGSAAHKELGSSPLNM